MKPYAFSALKTALLTASLTKTVQPVAAFSFSTCPILIPLISLTDISFIAHHFKTSDLNYIRRDASRRTDEIKRRKFYLKAHFPGTDIDLF